MAGFRVGSRTLWQALLDIADSDSSVDPRALLGVASRIWEAQDVYTEAMVAGYRRRATQEVLDDEAEKAALTEALLDGRLSTQASLWEVADLLRLPTRGPYVVVAAQAPSVGKQASRVSRPNCAAWTCIQRGAFCPINRSGSPTSPRNEVAASYWRSCVVPAAPGWA